MSHSIRIAAACALVFALGCEKKTKAKAETEPVAKPGPRETDKTEKVTVDTSKPGSGSQVTGTPQAPPVVTLKQPGGQPRRELRLHPKPGDKQKLVLLMRTEMEMQIAGMNNPPMKLPAMKMTMDMTVESIEPNGDIHYKFVLSNADAIDEPGVMPQVSSAIRTALGSAKGMSGTGVMSNRGFNKGTKLDVPPGADQQLKQILDGMKDSFNQIAAPLPEEAIGPGAVWDVKMTIVQQGMSLAQVATYELISLKGDVARAKSTLTQDAANQKIVNPSMPNLKIDLVKLRADGSGEVSFDLGQLVPPKAVADIHSEASMAMDMGAQKQTMTMKMDINVQVSSQ
jgi:hypothetical protein